MKIQVKYQEINKWIESFNPEIAKSIVIRGTENKELEVGYHVVIESVYENTLAIKVSSVEIDGNKVVLKYNTSSQLNQIVGNMLALLLSDENRYAYNFSMLSMCNDGSIVADLSKVEALSSFLDLMTIKAALNVETEYIEFEADLNLNK